MPKITRSNYKRSGIWEDPPPPNFSKFPHFPVFFLADVPKDSLEINLWLQTHCPTIYCFEVDTKWQAWALLIAIGQLLLLLFSLSCHPSGKKAMSVRREPEPNKHRPPTENRPRPSCSSPRSSHKLWKTFGRLQLGIQAPTAIYCK